MSTQSKVNDAAVWRPVSGVPNDADGNDGDWAIDAVVGTIYRKETGAWVEKSAGGAAASGGIVDVPEVSEKESFTPISNLSTNITLTGQKWRIGNMLHMEIQGAFTGANTDTSAVTITLPDSLAVDTSIFNHATNNGDLVFGGGAIRDVDTSTTYRLSVGFGGASVLRLSHVDTTNAWQSNWSTSAGSPVVIASGDFFTLRVAVPISGWNNSKSINVGKIPAMYSAETNFTINAVASAGWETVDLTTTVHDDKSIVDLANNKFVVPSGCDRAIVSAWFGQSDGTSCTSWVKIRKNTSSDGGLSSTTDTGGWTHQIVTTGAISVSPGDEFRAQIDVGTNTPWFGKFTIVCWNSQSPRASAFKGALIKKTSDQSLGTSTYDAMAFGDEEYDTDNFHDNVTNNSRFTIPSGISKVRFTANIAMNSAAPAGEIILTIYKNGAVFFGSPSNRQSYVTYDQTFNLVSPVLNVVAGDYFDLRVLCTAASKVVANRSQTWFAIEVVE